MATKINQTFYGNEANFNTVSTGVKKSPYSLPTIVTGNAYSGGALDYSAAPWGIGNSSVSNNFSVSICKGENWTYNENNRDAKNTPLFFYSVTDTQEGAYNNAGLVGSDVTSYNYELALFRSRIDPDVSLDVNNRFVSSMSIDTGRSVNFGGLAGTYPITYLDYQTVKAVVGHVYYKPVGENTIKKTTLDAIISNTVNVDSIVYFDYVLYDGNSVTNVDASVGGNELELLDIYKTVYYDDIDTIVSPARKIGRFGYWYISEQWDDVAGFHSGPSDSYADYQSEWDTLGNSDFMHQNPVYNGWTTLSGIHQEFDDVSYHWEYGITLYSENQWNITKVESGDTYVSDWYTSFAYLELDDYGGLTKNEAYAAAILHELAFLGLPIVASTSHLASEIGDNDVYVPVFDDHMITTGNYLSGSESLSLPNATWGDVFGVDIPEYDPTYDPTPGPGPGEEDDEGDLTNLGATRQPSLFNVLTFYAMNYLEFYGFIKEINDYYHGRTAEEWTLDFQGVNPAEYILGAYYTWFDLPINDVDVPVQIGRITLPTSTSRKLSAGDTMLRPSRWQYLTFGTKEIPHRYNDFRDYAPYTTIELYLPLAGTIELDTAYVMGHSITVRYYYSILTMTGVACVYRDDILYKTADVKIGSQIPLLSTNIGQYQNQITQLETARKQNSIRLAASALSVAGDAASAITSGGAGLSSLASLGKQLANTAILGLQQEQLEYQLNHLAPSLSVTGAAEASNSLCCGQLVPKLIIKRAKKLKTINDTVYSETVGNACCINDILGYVGGNTESPRTGLVVCSNVETTNMSKTVNNTTICPTVEEIQAIKQALANGVYL